LSDRLVIEGEDSKGKKQRSCRFCGAVAKGNCDSQHINKHASKCKALETKDVDLFWEVLDTMNVLSLSVQVTTKEEEDQEGGDESKQLESSGEYHNSLLSPHSFATS
jgi:hypothetical protein